MSIANYFELFLASSVFSAGLSYAVNRLFDKCNEMPAAEAAPIENTPVPDARIEKLSQWLAKMETKSEVRIRREAALLHEELKRS